jgi:hypothetical protein
MRTALALGVALALPNLAAAHDPEEALRLFLAKSDVVVLGEFATEPAAEKANGGFVHYQADFKITQILKWDAPTPTKAGDTILVHLMLEGEDRPPELVKGGKCLLFLECYRLTPKPSYITADFWFGVQRPNPALTKALARIVEDQKKTPLSVPAEKDIELFYPDPVRDGGYFKDFKVGKADLVKILRDYLVIPKQDWLHHYSHVGQGDRTGTIFLRDGTRIRYMVRPGGLATLTFLDGRKLYLAAGK